MNTESVRIVKAEKKDLNEICNIFQEVISTGETYDIAPDTSKDVIEKYWMSDDMETYVAQINNKVAGAYLLKANRPGLASHIANASYIVSAESRGHGIGKKMGEHSIARAKEKGFMGIQFNFVVSTNTYAVNLWKSLGFSIIGTIPNGYRHLQKGYVDAYIMYRALN